MRLCGELAARVMRPKLSRERRTDCAPRLMSGHERAQESRPPKRAQFRGKKEKRRPIGRCNWAKCFLSVGGKYLIIWPSLESGNKKLRAAQWPAAGY